MIDVISYEVTKVLKQDSKIWHVSMCDARGSFYFKDSMWIWQI